MTWTIVANGQSTSVPFYLHPDYEIEPFREAAVGNTPPLLAFDEGGPSVQGPLAMIVERTTTLAKPLTLTAWVSDDAKFTSSSGLPPRDLDTRRHHHMGKVSRVRCREVRERATQG